MEDDSIRIKYDSKRFKNSLDKFDNFFGFVARITLYLFAVACGLKKGPKPLTHSEALIRDTSIKMDEKALFFALFIANQNNETDNIDNTTIVYNYIQEYANSGLEEMQRIVDSGISENNYVNNLILELDTQYKFLFENT